MAQTNYTPISLYYSTTASAVPTAANLVPGELAINTNDGKLYYEDSSGVVQVLATKSTGSIGGSNTQVQFNNSGSLGGSSGLTWDGSFLTTSSIKNSALTSGRVTYAGASGLLSDSASLTFDGTSLTTPRLVLGGTTLPSAGTATLFSRTSDNNTYLQTGSGNNFNLLDGSQNTMATFSPTALNFNISNTAKLTLNSTSLYTASGVNVGIGTSSPINPLQVNGAITVSGAYSTLIATSVLTLDYSSGLARYFSLGANASTAGGHAWYGYSSNTGVGDERMRIDSSGNLLVGDTSYTTSKFRVLQSASEYTSRLQNNNASPVGLSIYYSGASPNGTSNSFIVAEDSTALRFEVRSNGGIANYAANNVILSDSREKTNFALSKSYLDVICAIPVQTFNYIDQNLEEDDGLTLGVTAQDVQAVAPELVSEGNWGSKENPKMRLEIYQTDMQYALMKALQELKAEFDAYKATHP